MAFLAKKFNTPDNWLPKDPAEQAKVNTYLHWHHLNIRYGLGYYLFKTKVLPSFDSSRKITSDQEDEMRIIRNRSLRFINDKLQSGMYVAGTSEVSIADISCFCEIEQLRMIGFDISPYPNIWMWQEKMRSIKGMQAAQKKFDSLFGGEKL